MDFAGVVGEWKRMGEGMVEILIGLREAASGVRIMQVVGRCLVEFGLSSTFLAGDVGCRMTQPPTDVPRIAWTRHRAGVRPLHTPLLKRRLFYSYDHGYR